MPDSENESVPPDPNETAIFDAEAEQQNFCDRCRSLNFDLLSSPSLYVRVPVSSLELGCYYCDNFRMIVSDFVCGSDTYTIHEIQLVRAKAIHSERFIVSLYLVVDTGLTKEGKPVTYKEGYDLVPLKSQRKGFWQTVKNCVRDEPAGFSMIKSSLEKCRTSHSDCHGKSYGMSVPLKVLDCQSRLLRTINPDESYAALSYVWGNVPAEPLINHQTLLLPKTIEDALSVCRRVGIQYIWVDRYCIDQEDPQEKHTLISQMDKIYRGAAFTIIAAAGKNPDYGLPGVNGTPQRHQIEFKTLNSSFTASRRLHQQVRSSTWSTRGWTYQEVLLSSRRVYFTDWEIIFECQTLCAREMVSDDLGSATLAYLPICPWLKSDQSFDEIYQRLCEYHRLNLTYSEDTIRAVEGVIHSFRFTCNTSWPFGASEGQHTIIHFYGAPCTSYKPWRNLTFLNSLLWQVLDPTVSTEILQMFPSWSWAVARTSASGRILFRDISTSLETEEQIWPLLITLSHHVRGEESLLNLGVHDDCTSYRPWFRIDTWLLNGRAEHPVAAPKPNFSFDKKESQKTDSIMAIVLKTLRRNWFTGIQCLLVEQIAPGDFRRVGFCELTINKLEDLRNPTWDEYKNANPGGLWGKDLHSSMKLVKAAFLKQVQGLVPDMTWELQERNLRLV